MTISVVLADANILFSRTLCDYVLYAMQVDGDHLGGGVDGDRSAYPSRPLETRGRTVGMTVPGMSAGHVDQQPSLLVGRQRRHIDRFSRSRGLPWPRFRRPLPRWS
ncbi:MAG: hypothetical protein J2P25_08205 [Nocardiopsaceae bacterium]|nr:hypothetical protein [Nocardiopsaceae bacterium]